MLGIARFQILFHSVWNLWNVLENYMQKKVKENVHALFERYKNQQYFMLKTVLDDKINPYFAFEIFSGWIVSRLDGEALEKMAGKLLHLAWQKQREQDWKK